MAQEDFGARELEEAEKVVDVIFPAGDEPPRVVEPGEEAFDLPATLDAPDGAAILRRAAAAPIAGNHLDAVVAPQACIERIAVIPLVADQARRERAEESGVERGGDEVRLMR